MFDCGFELAALLDKIDLETASGTQSTAEKLEQLLLSCFIAADGLEAWCNDHWTSQERRQYGLYNGGARQAHGVDPDHIAYHLEFGSILEATSVVYYWSFQLILNQTMLSLLRRIEEQHQVQSPFHATAAFDTAPKHPILDDTSTVESRGLYAPSQEQLAESSLELAIDIVLAASFFLRDGTGWLGPQKLFFPLRRAMAYLGTVSTALPVQMEAQLIFKSLIARLRVG